MYFRITRFKHIHSIVKCWYNANKLGRQLIKIKNIRYVCLYQSDLLIPGLQNSSLDYGNERLLHVLPDERLTTLITELYLQVKIQIKTKIDGN